MSGYESSFAGGEEAVNASPQFQHDATDKAVAEGEETQPIDTSTDDDLLDGEEAGMTG